MCVRSKYSTPRLTAKRLPVLRMCATFEGLTEFCFVFRFGFRASLLDFTSRIERLHVCYYCSDVWIIFYSECSRTRQSTGRSGQVIDSMCRPMSQFSSRSWPISCSRSTVAIAAPARLRSVARCALVHTIQTSCLQWDMTRCHTLETMLKIGKRK